MLMSVQVRRLLMQKLAKDFQVVLKEFQKAQWLAAEKEIAYAPFIPQAVRPSRCSSNSGSNSGNGEDEDGDEGEDGDDDDDNDDQQENEDADESYK